ncbi:MAG: polyprenyl synthetase family protein [Bacteroidales bacterium]|nr:polyprenyl synthetase family protein [Bacteroidales bacterium]MBK9356273.1 polyprenyl synthetase family protein [Bacteroidales bacterium]
MASLNEIKAPVEHHIIEFEKKFRDSMRSSVPLLDRITAYLVKRKGKQIRPLFVFLTAEISGGVNETTYRAASLIELLHTATLIHDDVVDDSNERRGFFSLNALWKNKISVLIGDFLLSKGLLLSLENDDFELLRIVSNATREMSEGELLQIEKARRLDIQEDVYFEIIRKKTASLIASCCASGAASAGADKDAIRRLHRFGELTGIAFQIKDDLFDYSKSLETGKPNGIDIKEKKMTLPLIYLLNNSDWLEKRRIINTVKHHNDNPARVALLIQQVKDAGGIAYAEKQMLEYRRQAIELLSGFEMSPARKSLEELVIFTTERKN